MSKRKDAQPDVDEPERDDDRPTRPGPGSDPDTLEGPGGRHESQAEKDARESTTRQGER